jgi:hypothetical protein
MPELISILEAKNNEDYENRKFLAALQGVDLDQSSSTANKSSTWEEIQARVFSGGKTSNPRDVMSLQGKNAKRKGFGIGMGLDAVTIDGDGQVTKIG